ncbi:uncharacterized protein METZ01_LOCUS276099, partial [marine metagenome]
MRPETSDVKAYLQSTPVMDADHPEIVARAEQITADSSSDV